MRGKYYIILLILCCLSCRNKASFSDWECDYIQTFKQTPKNFCEVIKIDKPWEKTFGYFSVLASDTLVHMYYTVSIGNQSFLCYAFSEDGLHWTKPDLGKYEYNENKQNNILLSGFIDGCCVFKKDEYIYFSAMYKDNKLALYKSRNGLDFSKIETFDVDYYIDSQYQIIYNPESDKFQLYLRGYEKVSKRAHYNHSDSIYRTVVYAETKDIEHFKLSYSADVFRKSGFPVLSKEFPIIMKNEIEKEDYDIYTSCVNYFGKYSCIAFPTLFYHDLDSFQGGERDNGGECYLSLWEKRDGLFIMLQNYLFDFSLVEGKQFYMAPGYVETEKSIILFFWLCDLKHGDPNVTSSYYAVVYNKVLKDL